MSIPMKLGDILAEIQAAGRLPTLAAAPSDVALPATPEPAVRPDLQALSDWRIATAKERDEWRERALKSEDVVRKALVECENTLRYGHETTGLIQIRRLLQLGVRR